MIPEERETMFLFFPCGSNNHLNPKGRKQVLACSWEPDSCSCMSLVSVRLHPCGLQTRNLTALGHSSLPRPVHDRVSVLGASVSVQLLPKHNTNSVRSTTESQDFSVTSVTLGFAVWIELLCVARRNSLTFWEIPCWELDFETGYGLDYFLAGLSNFLES